MTLAQAARIIQRSFLPRTTCVAASYWRNVAIDQSKALTRVEYRITVFTANDGKDCRGYTGADLKALVDHVITTELPYYTGKDKTK